MKPEELHRALDKGVIAPLYFFYGEETYLAERAVKRVMERVTPPDFRDFNLDVFYGDATRGEQIVAASQTLPMFADRRMVLVKRADALPAASLDALAEYAADPSPGTCLLLVGGEKIDQRKKFFATLKKADALVEFRRPYENQLPAFVREEASAHGKRIASEAAELLVYFIGNNLQEIVSQVEKVAMYVGRRDAITVDDVRAIVTDVKADSVFDLANALGDKNHGKAIRNLHTLMRDGEAPLMILAMISRHFRLLWKVLELVEKKTPSQDIPKLAGVTPFFISGFVAQSKKYNRHEMKEVFEKLLETDLQLKSSKIKGSFLLERLITEICRSGRR